MRVKRIVADIRTQDIPAARRFYHDVLGLELAMDQGWIATYRSPENAAVQISFLSQGGSGAPVPDLSIEVDDLQTALEGMTARGFVVEYGPVEEPWGVKRFFVRDPFGKLINILEHLPR